MRTEVTITLPERFSDNFGEPIQHIFNLLIQLNSAVFQRNFTLDYGNAKFTHPFYSLALPLIKKKFERKGYNIQISSVFEKANVSDYMSRIGFPLGVDPENIPQQQLGDYLMQFQDKSYLPIINFPTGSSTQVAEIRDKFLSALNNLIAKQCGLSGSIKTAVMYLIDEAVNNILHHANDDKGYLLAQFYRSKGYIDIAIGDIGRTLLESYQNFDKYKNEVTSHLLAMEAALAGKSTKSNNVDRGYGISTSKKMLVDGINGKYFLFSGNVFTIHTSETENIVELPDQTFWQGVLLLMRIPTVASSIFNYVDYLE
ncbi:hypothetical protein [Solitalea lacus]|uniref:hypothetical protein n=1 Tax=Solitalea lacus TaxID=2911172 RepID=UPI001EDB6543|nr:hypothetical protein [Solitalea lacus]UKJ06242.1 hypothetical protein L2B55_11915 [Solitalea lacus]